jgi:hypothetical protein
LLLILLASRTLGESKLAERLCLSISETILLERNAFGLVVLCNREVDHSLSTLELSFLKP